MTGIHKALIAIALLTTAGCGNAPVQEAGRCRLNTESQFVVAFWDRSASTSAADPSTLALVDSLHVLVRGALHCPKGQIAGFLVHGRTRGKANRARKQNSLDPSLKDGPTGRVRRDSIRYELQLRKLGDQAWQEFESLIGATTVSREVTAWTDLLGTFEVLSEELIGAPDQAVKRVYYLSDMFESMTGPGRRDFDRRPPKNSTEAREWARVDANFVRSEMNVDVNRFKDVDVRVLAGEFGNRPAAAEVKQYWLTLFAELDFPADRVRYN